MVGMINKDHLVEPFKQFREAKPFDFCVVDDFFEEDVAKTLSKEFPDFESSTWFEYKNQIEIKKACNNWNLFPQTTYAAFSYLNSQAFLDELMALTGISSLMPDQGLNGGGWHIHANGGKLNPHLDYSMHPKLPYQRKLNIIVYLQPHWEESWGGHLGLYEHDSDKQAPGKLIEELLPAFNRAVFFDTTQDSWHGLCREVTTPVGICRKSMAAYFLTHPPEGVDTRSKALFAPTKDQQDDQEVLDLIKKRSHLNAASSVYKK